MMNLVADDRITKTGEFAYQFAPFSAGFRQKPVSPLSTGEMGAFLNPKSENARSGHFSIPPAEPPAPTAEKSLAAGVLKQAANDLRRFRTATGDLKRELYLDAHSWITGNDFSWPYSFLNVCKLLEVSPDFVRAEILADASLGWLDYWTQRAGRLSRTVRASFVSVFASCNNPHGAEANHLA
ncbi:MAG TPA: hypothetical protein VH229_11845 [Candidatus Udaeobacter sp.]|nr:hypothetical protein [Candidatus Udaeobacter sp.]